MPIKTAIIAVMEITTPVAPIISWRVDQETLPNSVFTSPINPLVFLITFIAL